MTEEEAKAVAQVGLEMLDSVPLTGKSVPAWLAVNKLLGGLSNGTLQIQQEKPPTDGDSEPGAEGDSSGGPAEVKD